LAVNAGLLWNGEFVSPNLEYDLYTEQLDRNRPLYREIALPRQPGFEGYDTRACGVVTDSLSAQPVAGIPASLTFIWDDIGEDIELLQSVATDSTGAFCVEAFHQVGLVPTLMVNENLRRQAADRNPAYRSFVESIAPSITTNWDVRLAPR
jgi:hypothetical protein